MVHEDELFDTTTDVYAADDDEMEDDMGDDSEAGPDEEELGEDELEDDVPLEDYDEDE